MKFRESFSIRMHSKSQAGSCCPPYPITAPHALHWPITYKLSALNTSLSVITHMSVCNPPPPLHPLNHGPWLSPIKPSDQKPHLMKSLSWFSHHWQWKLLIVRPLVRSLCQIYYIVHNRSSIYPNYLPWYCCLDTTGIYVSLSHFSFSFSLFSLFVTRPTTWPRLNVTEFPRGQRMMRWFCWTSDLLNG